MRKLTRERLLLVETAGEDYSRPEIEGVWIEADGTAMATDSIAIVVIGPSKEAAGDEVRIPARLAKTVLAGDEDEIVPDLVEMRIDGGRLTIAVEDDEHSVPLSEKVRRPEWRGKLIGKHLAATPKAEFRMDMGRLRNLCNLLEKLGNRAGMQVVIPQGETEPVLFLGKTDGGTEVIAALMPMLLGDGRGKWATQLAKEWKVAHTEGKDG